MIKIPTLETDRLILRAPREDDHEKEMEFYSSEHSRFVGGQKNAYDVSVILAARLGHWMMHGFGFWHMDEKATGTYVGRCGLLFPFGWPERELGWSLMPSATGHGYATEAAKAARSYAYNTLGWTTVVSMIDPANTGSEAVAKRLGATFEDTYEHINFGTMYKWRHPSPEALL